MADIEQKALALVNEVADDSCHEMDDARFNEVCSALYLSIQQHEAFRQEVSDAVEALLEMPRCDPDEIDLVAKRLARFIIAKPDPLVEALAEATGQGENYIDERDAIALRAAIEKRGGKIVWGKG